MKKIKRVKVCGSCGSLQIIRSSGCTICGYSIYTKQTSLEMVNHQEFGFEDDDSGYMHNKVTN